MMMIKEKNRNPVTRLVKPNRIKVGTILNRETLQRLKARAAREGSTISALIEEAVLAIEQGDPSTREKRRQALNRFLNPVKPVPVQDLRALLDEDVYEQ